MLPFQNPLTPDSRRMLTNAFLVLVPAALCDRVLIVSKGCVAYTVMVPAAAPMPKVAMVPCGMFAEINAILRTL